MAKTVKELRDWIAERLMVIYDETGEVEAVLEMAQETVITLNTVDLESVHEAAKKIELEVRLEVTAELDNEGTVKEKPRYSNEGKRSAEIVIRLKDNVEYHRLKVDEKTTVELRRMAALSLQTADYKYGCLNARKDILVAMAGLCEAMLNEEFAPEVV